MQCLDLVIGEDHASGEQMHGQSVQNCTIKMKLRRELLFEKNCVHRASSVHGVSIKQFGAPCRDAESLNGCSGRDVIYGANCKQSNT